VAQAENADPLRQFSRIALTIFLPPGGPCASQTKRFRFVAWRVARAALACGAPMPALRIRKLRPRRFELSRAPIFPQTIIAVRRAASLPDEPKT
jgi:hypothetical protein